MSNASTVVPLVAWGAALVVAVLVLGYCAYQVSWRAKRLRGDLAQLQTLSGDLTSLQARIADTQLRLVEATHSTAVR